jgi:hypothetical protein
MADGLPHTSSNPRSAYAKALDAWRAAAELSRDRWHQFTIAERESRPFMFAAYSAALDREQAAARAFAMLTLERAA